MAPGVLLFGAALALRSYALQHRLVVTETAIRIEDVHLIDLKDIGVWSCGPLGLKMTSRTSGETVYVPPFFNAKDVEAILGERIS